MKWKFSGKHFQKLVKMHIVWPSFSEMHNETTQSDFITFMWNLKLELEGLQYNTNIPMVHTTRLLSSSAAVLCPVTLLSTFKTGPRFFSTSTSSSLTTPTFLWNKFSP